MRPCFVSGSHILCYCFEVELAIGRQCHGLVRALTQEDGIVLGRRTAVAAGVYNPQENLSPYSLLTPFPPSACSDSSWIGLAPLRFQITPLICTTLTRRKDALIVLICSLRVITRPRPVPFLPDWSRSTGVDDKAPLMSADMDSPLCDYTGIPMELTFIRDLSQYR